MSAEPHKQERDPAHSANHLASRLRLLRASAQNKLLRSRIAGLKEAAARKAQDYKDLERMCQELRDERTKDQEAIDCLASRLEEQESANGRLQSAIMGRTEGRLRMCESYEGVVVDRDGDRVTVDYDVNGDIVEQTYERSQFLEGRLPEVDTELVAHVLVAEIEPRAAEPESTEDQERDPVSGSQRKPLTGPTVF